MYMGGIDRNRVRSSFTRQASVYDGHAGVQRRVVERFAGLLKAEGARPARLLDVGAGTGSLLALLRGRYPEAFIVGMDLAEGMCRTSHEALGGEVIACADAERLPFADASFDLVVSTSTFQWLSTLDAAFGEAFRVLAPGGLFSFALFGERTLFELRSSYRRALERAGRSCEDRTHRFFSAADVKAALERAGFASIRTFSEPEVDRHPDVPALLRSLRRIGAGNAAPSPPRGLAGREVMLEMMKIYSGEFGGEEGIPATYEVIYGAGRKC